VAPRHIAPENSRWIVLIEEVIFTFIEEQSIGIIHPVARRGEMKTRTEFFREYIYIALPLHGAYLILIS
jgi:hypothetical protein